MYNKSKALEKISNILQRHYLVVHTKRHRCWGIAAQIRLEEDMKAVGVQIQRITSKIAKESATLNQIVKRIHTEWRIHGVTFIQIQRALKDATKGTRATLATFWNVRKPENLVALLKSKVYHYPRNYSKVLQVFIMIFETYRIKIT